MNTLYVMQGPPGSGKSYVANALSEGLDADVCSTDDYFYEGTFYNFQPSKLVENHAKNLKRACDLLEHGRTVIVDNTNIQRWQCREYVRFAVNKGIPVVFIRCTGQFNTVHGVPPDKIEQMRASLEDLTVESVLNSKAPWEK